MQCPFCSDEVKFRESSKFIYGKDYGPVYVCSNFPLCSSFVGCHKGTIRPYGTLANGELRGLRRKCHRLMDKIIVAQKCSMDSIYSLLKYKLHISGKLCHIGIFNVLRCRDAIVILESKLKEEL